MVKKCGPPIVSRLWTEVHSYQPWSKSSILPKHADHTALTGQLCLLVMLRAGLHYSVVCLLFKSPWDNDLHEVSAELSSCRIWNVDEPYITVL